MKVLQTNKTTAQARRAKHRGKQALIPKEEILVHVASFTFRFVSVEQVRECLAYYQKKTHPSSRIQSKQLAAEFGEDWRSLRKWEVERWFERLPMYLLENPKREKVVKALSEAVRLIKTRKVSLKQNR